jgi:hypothetical protein
MRDELMAYFPKYIRFLILVCCTFLTITLIYSIRNHYPSYAFEKDAPTILSDNALCQFQVIPSDQAIPRAIIHKTTTDNLPSRATLEHGIKSQNQEELTPSLPEIDASGYLTYHTHSGYSNQVLSFQTALLLALIMNRTLVAPPVMLGPRCTLDWRPFDLLEGILEDIYQDFQERQRYLKAGKSIYEFVEKHLLQKEQLHLDCQPNTISSLYRKIHGKNLTTSDGDSYGKAELKTAAQHIKSCFLRRQKLFTGSKQALRVLYYKKDSQLAIEGLMAYHKNWELIPFSSLFNLTDLPVRLIEQDVFARLKGQYPSRSLQVKDLTRYHYQLWDNKEKDLTWRRRLISPLKLKEIHSLPDEKERRRRFYHEPLPRSAYRYNLTASDLGPFKLRDCPGQIERLHQVFELSDGSAVSKQEIRKSLPEDPSWQGMHRNGHYLCTLDVVHNILPAVPAPAANTLNIVSIGSLFGTARVRIRQKQHHADMRQILSRIGHIIQPTLLAQVDRLQGRLDASYLAMHLRGGEGGGFSRRVGQVIEKSLSYFASQVGTTDSWQLYIATDMPAFRSTTFYATLKPHFRAILLYSDLEAEADAQDKETSFLSSLYYPLIEQLLASRAYRFYGTEGSTFTGLIHKMRQARSKGK